MITFYADQRTVAVTNGRHTRLCRAMTRVNRVFSLFSVLYETVCNSVTIDIDMELSDS